jgi:hypothetical protein
MQTLYELGCNKKLLLESINLISWALKIEVQKALDIHDHQFDNLMKWKGLSALMLWNWIHNIKSAWKWSFGICELEHSSYIKGHL